MSKIRFGFALVMAKLSVVALKVTRHNGTNFPGIVALKLCPDFLKYVNKPEMIIGITGTNGKTTTSNMVKDLLEADGKDVLNNSLGSNINTGIATCLLSGVSLFNREKYKIGVLEIDERSAIRIFPYVHPNYMIVTNLSRDSIMRNAHPEFIRDFITRYLPKSTKLILNADDLIASSVAPENPRVYFGIEKLSTDDTECRNLIGDMQICPKCSTKLKYRYIRYSNIGKAYCPNCGFTSPEYTVSGSDIDHAARTLIVKDDSGSVKIKIMQDGIFNIYNQVAAAALLRQMGYPLSKISGLFDQIHIVGSRLGVTEIGDKKVIHMFCKGINAYAESRIFEYLRTLPGDKELIFLTNSVHEIHHWSENVSWIYDTDFEFLKDDRNKSFILYGDRGYDYKLRLLLAGIPEDRITIVEDSQDTPDQLKYFPNDNIFVLYGADAIDIGMAATKKITDKLRQEQKKGADA
ncbi:MAG: MurT ligase domain-containing protein [Eubacteriales bacterium]|nr:MurT ligase domain-containing protein [Eubacteriales bacterium]